MSSIFGASETARGIVASIAFGPVRAVSGWISPYFHEARHSEAGHLVEDLATDHRISR